MLPTLSTQGYIDDDELKLKKLLDYFKSSDFSQTIFYTENVSSLKYLIFKYGNNINDFEINFITTLKNYLLKYYDDVDISIKLLLDDKPGTYSFAIINLDLTVTKDNNKIKLGDYKIFIDNLFKNIEDNMDIYLNMNKNI